MCSAQIMVEHEDAADVVFVRETTFDPSASCLSKSIYVPVLGRESAEELAVEQMHLRLVQQITDLSERCAELEAINLVLRAGNNRTPFRAKIRAVASENAELRAEVERLKVVEREAERRYEKFARAAPESAALADV